MISLQVKDFGPVIEGHTNLKPLTIFIGPNNTGKTYLAMLMYALFVGYSGGLYPWRRRAFLPFGFRPPSIAFNRESEEQIKKVLEKWFKEHPSQLDQNERAIPIEEVPELGPYVKEGFDSHIKHLASEFGKQLRRCFGADIVELVRKESSAKGVNIRLHLGDPKWELLFSSTNNTVKAEQRALDLSVLTLRFDSAIGGRIGRLKARPLPEEWKYLWFESLAELLTRLTGFPRYTLYLPAARSGILQGHRALASEVVRIASFAGIEPLEIPPLSGVIADFIGPLLLLEKRRGMGAEGIAKFLEQDVTMGEIDIEPGKTEYPEIVYRSRVGRFPVHRTSSMVSELAPLVLFLKYRVGKGVLLIIEEPESHLHPGAQRKLAQGMVRLIRKGVRLLITTHSDYFVSQLSNFILLSQVSGADRGKAGYSEDDYLEAKEVGAYLFKMEPRQGGSTVKELKVTAKDGIPEHEFVKVAAALGNEAARLERLVRKSAK